MSESQTGFLVYQFGMLKTEADIERIRCEKRAEDAKYLYWDCVYNFARGFVWVWNLVADTEGGTQAESVWE